jgi:cell division protein FtsB
MPIIVPVRYTLPLLFTKANKYKEKYLRSKKKIKKLRKKNQKLEREVKKLKRKNKKGDDDSSS